MRNAKRMSELLPRLRQPPAAESAPLDTRSRFAQVYSHLVLRESSSLAPRRPLAPLSSFFSSFPSTVCRFQLTFFSLDIRTTEITSHKKRGTFFVVLVILVSLCDCFSRVTRPTYLFFVSLIPARTIALCSPSVAGDPDHSFGRAPLRGYSFVSVIRTPFAARSFPSCAPFGVAVSADSAGNNVSLDTRSSVGAD